jgi:hypothetical protein
MRHPLSWTRGGSRFQRPHALFVCTGVGEILIGEAFMTRNPKSSRSWGVYSNMDRVWRCLFVIGLIVQFFEHSRQSGDGDASKFRREDGEILIGEAFMTRNPKSSRSWGVYSNMDRSVKNKIDKSGDAFLLSA